MELEAQIRSFLNYLRVEKGLSDNTMYAYQRDMMKFAEFATKQKVTLAQVERAHVVNFLRSLYLKKLDSRSLARHLVTIRHFFRFCFAEGLIQEDPAANVQSPKFRQSLPEFLSLAEGDRLLAQPDATSTLGLRDKAMIELLYSTGLRVSELCGLKINDIQMDVGCLRCIGKGNKERLVPGGKQALQVVQEYITRARPQILGERVSPFLFPSRAGSAINRIAFWKTVGMYGRKAGLSKAPTPPNLRPN